MNSAPASYWQGRLRPKLGYKSDIMAIMHRTALQCALGACLLVYLCAELAQADFTCKEEKGLAVCLVRGQKLLNTRNVIFTGNRIYSADT